MDLLSSFPGLGFCPHRPEPRQSAFLLASLMKREVLFGGAAGGGKSDAMLMAALQYVDVPGYSAIVFRRTFTDLALPGAIMSRSHEWLANTEARWNEQKKIWTFPSGATIAFGYLDKPRDEYRYQGAEFQTVCFDELTQFDLAPYLYLFSRLRRLRESPVPIRMLSASNPGGIGHHWVAERFMKAPGPDRVFIPSRLSDNPHLDAESYEQSLLNLPDLLRRQLLDGDWAAVEGLAYPEFREDLHVVPRFAVDAAWERFEFMDHGTANPAAWFVAATDYDGNVVVFDSYYSPGIVSDHCRAVLERRPAWYPSWTDANGVTHEPVADAVVADPSVRTRTSTLTQWGEAATIATEYQEQSGGKIVLLPGNNDPKAGRARVAEMLRPDVSRPFPAWHPRYGELGSPRLFVVGESCPELVGQLMSAPLLPLDAARLHAGEIVDPGWEGPHGHAVAALRYGMMSRPDPSPPPPPEPDDPRAELMRQVEQRRNDDDQWGSYYV